MQKKIYTKPELKTREIKLGVFGDYGDQGGDQSRNVSPGPIDVIRKLDLHME